MGREIRRVPPNWEHPRRKCPHEPWHGGCTDAKAHNGMCYQPMHDDDFDHALGEWLAEYVQWKNGTHPDYDPAIPFQEWIGGPPDPDYYHPKWEVEPTWYQLYETVSEGCPVSPPFATKEELIDYLAKHGDFWAQLNGEGGYDRKAAERIVNGGYAPSLITVVQNGEMKMYHPGHDPEQ